MAGSPVHLDVYHGIVSDVERIGEGAQELAQFYLFFAFQRASGTCQDDCGEKQKDSCGTINTVADIRLVTTNVGPDQCDCKQKAANEKSISRYGYAFSDTIEQQTSKEWIEQPAQADINLVGTQTEASYDRVGRIAAVLKQSENIEIETYVDSEESRAGYENGQGDF